MKPGQALLLCLNLLTGRGLADAPCPEACATPVYPATVILADGSSGSTWLGQLLHNHPCSGGYVVDSARLDGKVFIDSLGEMSSMLLRNKRTRAAAGSAGGAAYGLVVPWQAMDKLLKHKRTGPGSGRSPDRNTSSADGAFTLLGPSFPPLPRFTVVVLLRDPFFWVLSQEKKLSLRDAQGRPGSDSNGATVQCTNIHQRGSSLCPVTAAYRFAVDPGVLDLRIREFEAKIELMRSVGAAAALRWGNARYIELDYGELLCAKELLGADRLPEYLASAVGLGSKCGTARAAASATERLHGKDAAQSGATGRDSAFELGRRLTPRRRGAARLRAPPLPPPPPPPPGAAHAHGGGHGMGGHEVGAVKTSPSAPAAELLNLGALARWARDRRAPWAGRLGLRRESDLLNCSAAADSVRSPRSAAAARAALSTIPVAPPRLSPAALDVASPDGTAAAGEASPLFHYDAASLAVLASPKRAAHYQAELRRLHVEYQDAVAKLPRNHRITPG